MSLKRTAIIITIIALFSKLLGFLREVLFAYFFGTSYIIDAYLMASSIPVILMAWLYHISYSIAPIYLNAKVKQGIKNANEFINSLLFIVSALSVVCVILLNIFPEIIVKICAPGFEGDIFDITINFFRVSIYVQVVSSICQIFINFLNSNNRFMQSNFAALLLNIVQIVFIALSGITKNIMLLVYGGLTASLVFLICLYVMSLKNGFILKFKFKYDDNIKDAINMSIPILISNGIMQFNLFVDKWFASKLTGGSISALNYAGMLRNFVVTVFTIAMTTMIYPIICQAVAEKDMDKVKDVFHKGINIIIILFIPLTVGSIILGKPAISFVFLRGEFNETSVFMTSSAFVMYTLGIFSVALSDVITKVFYAMQDTKSTLIISSFSILINVTLNTLLVKRMGHTGLALATSMASIISTPLFFVFLRKKIGALRLSQSAKLFVKACLSSALMGVVLYYEYKYLIGIVGSGKIELLLFILTNIVMGGIIYLLSMLLLNGIEVGPNKK